MSDHYIEMMSVTNEEVSDWLNRGKDVFVDKLVRDGVLTAEKGEEICSQYILSLHKNKRLTSYIKKFLQIEDEKEGNSTIVCSKL